MGTWACPWGSQFIFPFESVSRTHRTFTPVSPSEPVLRSEEPVFTRGKAQPLWQGWLLGKALVASVGLWGRLFAISEDTARGSLCSVSTWGCCRQNRSSSWRWCEMLRKRALLSTSYQPRDGQRASWLLGCHPRASERKNRGHRIKSTEGLPGMTRQPMTAQTQSCLNFNLSQ